MIDVSRLICGSASMKRLRLLQRLPSNKRCCRVFTNNEGVRTRRVSQGSNDFFTKLCNSSGPVPDVRLSSIASRGRRFDRSRLGMRKTSMAKTTFRLNLAQQAWAERKISAFAEHCRFPSSAPVVVEVGSFVGGFLAAAQRRGWSIRGVDPGREVVNFCQGRGLSVFYGTLNDATIAE